MDYGHTLTEKELAKLEKRIAKEYNEARKSVKKKAASALEKYEEKYEKQKALYKQGIITNAELKEWKKKQLAQYNYFSDLQKVLAQDCANVNAIALKIINQSNIDIYALNMNYGTYEIESGLNINTSFTLYDHDTVEQLLLTKDAGFMPVAKQNIPKDIRWNRKHVASQITQGILAGDSIPQIAKRLQTVTDMNQKAAIRNARTYTTAAENAGRIDSYERAQKLGINLKQQWIASLDARVRDSHALLDGEIVEIGEKFSNGLRYPADPTGAPEEVYNCRCTLVAALDGFDNSVNDLNARFSRLENGITYDEWKEQHDKVVPIQNKLDAVQKKYAELKQHDKIYKGIWLHETKLSEYESKKDSIPKKIDYYDNQIKTLEDLKAVNGLTPSEEAKLKEFKESLESVKEYQVLGEKFALESAEYKKQIKELQGQLKTTTKTNENSIFGTDAYSQERKDSALWAKRARDADNALRERTGEVWRDASKEEKDAIFEYTSSYSKFNEPLRGYEYGTNVNKGVGNTDLNAGYRKNGKKLNAMTDIIDKCSYDEDVWLQRGCGYGGMDNFFGIDMDILKYGSQEELENELLGKAITDYGFMSCGTSKGKGFSSNPIMMNVYAPSGTKMMYVEPFSAFGMGDKRSWDGHSKQSSFGSELETILQQGTEMRITKIERSGRTIYFDLEVINQKEPQRWIP